MIRFITDARLRELIQDTGQAHASAQEAQGHAAEVWRCHIQRVRHLTQRAESAEGDAAILREDVSFLRAALKEATAAVDGLEAEVSAARRAAAEPVALLLRSGVPHSVHGSVHAAKEHAALHGASPSGWAPQTDPSTVSDWLVMPVRRSGGGS
ncbi:hypothetical protein QNO07_16130 [Streptomyces sp. 549]|uniref:hypothetical protein n=1 Tax=Streptomyces sp. 549 TaxID=3049076 RepID=UPI0024C282F4|nr:hypothetical protein [Streptomyces sp. 549]MDK1474932.1 hypothetical protein [Streptomyces sp. 549]